MKRWKDFASDIQVDWVRMAQNVLRYNVVIVGRFSTRGAWSLMYGERSTQRSSQTMLKDLPRELKRLVNEKND